jgi:hypothetical protein
MLATETCPICGSARTGSFRFCRSCGLDYDPAEGNAVETGSAMAAPAPPSILGDEPDAVTDGDALPGSFAASSATAAAATIDTPERASPPASDVIVIQKRHVRMAVGALAGGFIGAMISGALVVPFLGEALVTLGAVAAVATIAVGAFLGARVASRTA